MPAPLKPLALSEPELKRIFGPKRLARAERNLLAGHPALRQRYHNNVLLTHWASAPDAPQQILFSDRGEPGFDCTCPAWQRGDDCDHVVAAALAWVRDPGSFAPQPEAFDFDQFYADRGYDEVVLGDDFDDDLDEELAEDSEEDDFEEDFDEADASEFGASLTAVVSESAPGTEGEPALITVGLEVPDLAPAYREVLSALTLPQMRALAERRGVRLPGNKREPALDALAQALSRPGALAEVWPSLSPAARLVLGALPYLTTYMGVMRAQLPPVLDALQPKLGQRAETALEELREAGLVVAGNYGALAWPRGLQLRLPPDPDLLPPRPDSGRLRVRAAPPGLAFAALTSRLLAALHGAAPTLRVRPAREPHPLELKFFGSGQQWPYEPGELEALALQPNAQRALRQYSLSVPLAPPLLDDASHEALAREQAVDPLVLNFALGLLRALGQVEMPPGQAPMVNAQTFVGFLSQHPLLLALPLFTAYLNDTSWTEFDLARRRDPDLILGHPAQPVFNFSYSQLLQVLASARAALIKLLRRAPAGEWIALDTVVDRAYALNAQNGLWPAPGTVILFHQGQNLNGAHETDWRRFYTPYLEAIVAGPLHWQGLIDLGYDKDQLVAFRLTTLGAFVLLQLETLAAPAMSQGTSTLAFLPGGGLRLRPAGAKTELVRLLGQLGQVSAGPDGTLDYAVSAQGASQALRSGWSSDRILAVLADGAGAPVPAELAGRLREWEARTGEVQLYERLALVELADDYALDELLAGTSLARYLLYRFSPRLVAIRPEGVEALRDELVARGYTPRLETGP
ncbi:MAG: helicase-associated domain-containing protein [Anaerolineales bacterium]|nr:helicase-associated domain-containing protein [Anaerolineales bacterium]